MHSLGFSVTCNLEGLAAVIFIYNNCNKVRPNVQANDDERYQLRSWSLSHLHKSFGKGDSHNLLGNAGLKTREIMAISGYRNESSFQSYHNMSPVKQLRKCNDVFTAAVGDDDRAQTTEQPLNQIVRCATRPPLQQLPVPPSVPSTRPFQQLSRTQLHTVRCSIVVQPAMSTSTVTSHKWSLPFSPNIVYWLSCRVFITFVFRIREVKNLFFGVKEMISELDSFFGVTVVKIAVMIGYRVSCDDIKRSHDLITLLK